MNGNFFTMQNDIFKCGLSAYEFIVYAYLVMKADRKTGTCYPSAAKIAGEKGNGFFGRKGIYHKRNAVSENRK